ERSVSCRCVLFAIERHLLVLFMIANDKFLGGIITVSSQILCMEDGVIDTVLGHINHQKKTSPTALWLFKIHSDTFRHLREIIDNVSDVHSRNRLVKLLR